MNQYIATSLVAILSMLTAAIVQVLLQRRTLKSTERHMEYEEVAGIADRLGDEITRKDARITDLERQVRELQDQCRNCPYRLEHKEK